MTERFALRFSADTAAEAIEKAKAWVRAEPSLSLRTIASCRPIEGTSGWVVTVAVRRVPA